MSTPLPAASSNPPPQRLNTALVVVTAAAAAELAPVWGLSLPDIGPTLMRVLPPLLDKWGTAAGSAAAEWYDQLRVSVDVPGRFRARVKLLDEPGAEALAGWGAQALKTAPAVAPKPELLVPQREPVKAKPTPKLLRAPLDPVEAARYRVEGGLQKRLVNTANLTVTDNTVRDAQARGYMRRTRPSDTYPAGCKFCQMVASRGAVYTKASATFACHENCFPADVLVTSPSVEIGYRRAYQGELVIIRFANGQELPVTPNHPILTRRGWIPAGQVRIGEDVFERSGADLASLDVPHENDVPARIEDVWGANRMDRLGSVPVTAEDFHGDIGAQQGYVDVVAPDSLLAKMRDLPLSQPLAEIVRSAAGATAVLSTLAAASHGLEPLFGPRTHSARGLVSSLGMCSAHSGIFALRANGLGLSHSSYGNAGLLEPAVHYGAGNAIRRGHREHTRAGVVVGHQVGGSGDAILSSNSMPSGAGRYTVTLQRKPDAIAGLPSENGSDLIKRLARGIQPLSVVDLTRSDFSGHVYNLQTAEGWYSANGVIVHNCHCEAIPAWGGQPLPVGPYKPSARPMSSEDRARVKKWIADNLS